MKEKEVEHAGRLYANWRAASWKNHQDQAGKDIFCARERAVAVADYQTRRIRELNGEILKQPAGRGSLDLERSGQRNLQTLHAITLANGGGPLGTMLKKGRQAQNTESVEDSFARLESRPGLDLYHHTIDRERSD